jgi:predicted RNA binding protein YcfA (HicA-like mRNA interferase family)
METALRIQPGSDCPFCWRRKQLQMPRVTPVHYRKIVRILEHEGSILARERGDQMVFTKSEIARPVVVLRYDLLPVFIIKKRFAHRRHFTRTLFRVAGDDLTSQIISHLPAGNRKSRWAGDNRFCRGGQGGGRPWR